MSISDIEQLLQRTMGLNASSIGSASVQSAVNARMTACDIGAMDAYAEKLQSDQSEIRELIEEIVVPETWFFRDQTPFKMLRKFVREEWLPAEPDRPLRVLSLPCATGEEPFSIAITLLEAGLMPSQLKIDAFDISTKNIKRCREASYRNNSFRGVDAAIQSRYFHMRDGKYKPDIVIWAMVNFDTASVFDPLFTHARATYDVIFCRNMLIYFDKEAQQRAAGVLERLLTPQGVLFVGHAETGLFIGKWHVSHRYPNAFAVRKFVDDERFALKSRPRKTRAAARRSGTTKKSARPAPHASKPIRTGLTPAAPGAAASSTQAQRDTKRHADSLEEAKRLADAGRLVEAEGICMRHLEHNKCDEQAYFLLALIQLSNGDVQKAAKYLKNVVYLNPGHYEALMYLSTLSAEQGDSDAAGRYRQRAARIKSRRDMTEVSS